MRKERAGTDARGGGWGWAGKGVTGVAICGQAVRIKVGSGPRILRRRVSAAALISSLPHLSSRGRRNLWMSQQSAAAKPSLQGVRIKARKRAVKAQAKHEPDGERDNIPHCWRGTHGSPFVP